jgi:ribonuclease J
VPKPSLQLLNQQSGPFFLALGGAGEIGANLYIYGCQGYWIAIDCGQGFRSTPGGETQSVVPNIQALEDNGIKIQAILITHSHEDHIGALPWLWKRLNCPVYASPFAAGLIEKRVDLGNSKLKLHHIRPLKTYSFGPFQAEWIPVTHSIPEAHGIYLQAGGRKLYHTGDWKLDPNPVVGHLTAIKRLQEIGNQGLDLVVGDSTNAPNSGHSESELQVQEGLHRLIKPLSNRVLVTCFASNVALPTLFQTHNESKQMRGVALLACTSCSLYRVMDFLLSVETVDFYNARFQLLIISSLGLARTVYIHRI